MPVGERRDETQEEKGQGFYLTKWGAPTQPAGPEPTTPHPVWPGPAAYAFPASKSKGGCQGTWVSGLIKRVLVAEGVCTMGKQQLGLVLYTQPPHPHTPRRHFCSPCWGMKDPHRNIGRGPRR